MIAVFACARCILYPDTKVLIASGQKSQAALIITQKIEKELIKLPNLRREIKNIKTGASEATVFFHNGSTIEAIASTDGSRGYRGNILILEEFRLIKLHILDAVLKPFLNVYRQPPFLKKPEYEHLTEENVEIYISSAWYSNHWMQDTMLSARDAMLKGTGDAAMFSMDYLASLYHNLLSRKRIEQIKADRNFDAINFSIEYENIMYGQSADALFSLDDVNKNRLLKPKDVFYPIDNLDYESMKDKKGMKFEEGEIRIIGVDVALMGGNKNDISVITCMRLLPRGNNYLRKVVYIETIDGGHSEDQAIRIKQIFEDFEASYVALDAGGVGMAIYDFLSTIQMDEVRGVKYEAWSAYNDETMASRAKSSNPLPVVFSIKTGGQGRLNHEVATSLRNGFKNFNIELPMNEFDAREIMSEKPSYQDSSAEVQVSYDRPFLQTTMLVNELVNLGHEIRGGLTRVEEKPGQRKDRYSSIAYANYLARLLEEELSGGQTKNLSAKRMFNFRKPKAY